jgi:PAS domain S-box-containing protein
MHGGCAAGPRFGSRGEAATPARGAAQRRWGTWRWPCGLALLVPLLALGQSAEPAGDQRPVLVVGDADYRPLSFLEEGKPKGLDVEMAEALGRVLGRPVKIELMQWELAQAKVRSGEADVLMGMSVTEERKAAYDFSTAAFDHEFALFFRAGETAGFDDLAGRRVGVTQAGYPRAVLERRAGVEVVPVESFREGFDRLSSGDIDAFAADLWVGAYIIHASHLSGIVTSGRPFATQPYAMAVRKGNLALVGELNRALSVIRKDGTFARIQQRWRPHEMVFAPRRTVRRTLAAAAGVAALLLLGLMALWIAALKRHAHVQRRVEAELRESEERLRLALATFPDAIVMTRSDGVVTSVNEGFTRVSGWSASEVLGRKLAEVELWAEPAQRSAFLESVLAGGAVQNVEVAFLTRGGARLTALVSGCAISVNRERYVLGIARDITDRKRVEAEREAALRELEALKAQLEEENLYLKEEIGADRPFAGFVGDSDALKHVRVRIGQVAGSDSTVLVQGETGVGKELVARAVHEASKRSGAAFIRVNCASLPASIVESELFGHEAGAFTGATRLRKGRFELANGGTLFLDEVGELPLELQAKLLRALQEGEFERVGSSDTMRVDVRVIAATNRDLAAEVAAGRFRKDLYYRLNVFPLTIPPLRERREDIPPLVRHLLPPLAARAGKPVREVPAAVLRALGEYHWPGNVRELRNVLERAVLQSSDGVLHLAERLEPGPSAPQRPSGALPLRHDEAERAHIRAVLELTQGRVNGRGGAAELLGINPNTLRSRMKKLGIQPLSTKRRHDIS